MKKLLCVVLLLVPAALHGEVTSRSATAFSVQSEMIVSAPPERAYALFVNEIDQWDDEHTVSGDAGNFWLQPNPGGCLCETLANGGGVEHAEVIYVVPNEIIRMRASLGPLQEYAVFGAWTWMFAPADAGQTRVTMQYHVTGTFPGGLEAVAAPVDQVLSDQGRRFKEHVDFANKRPVFPIPR
jgi:uncharacterized protein YndB with AHSA1/START domain